MEEETVPTPAIQAVTPKKKRATPKKEEPVVPPTQPAPAPVVEEPVVPKEPEISPVDQQQRVILLERSLALRNITQIFRNGAYSMGPGHRPFIPHTGLMQQMRVAYDRGDTDAYIQTVQSYLEQACKQLPHAGLPHEVPAKITALRQLIEQIGLQMVGQRMLAVIGAPI